MFEGSSVGEGCGDECAVTVVELGGERGKQCFAWRAEAMGGCDVE